MKCSNCKGAALEGFTRCASCREVARRASAAYLERNKEKRLSDSRARHRSAAKADPTFVRRRNLWQYYGITLEEYEEMLDRQRGVCAICGQPETSKYKGVVKNLSVDHCHVTGEVRGLLCNNCNRAIGLLGDDLGRIWDAATYLASFRNALEAV